MNTRTDATDDDDLQAWLDAREPDTEHAKAMERQLHQLNKHRTFEDMKADFQRELELRVYARAIGAKTF